MRDTDVRETSVAARLVRIFNRIKHVTSYGRPEKECIGGTFVRFSPMKNFLQVCLVISGCTPFAQEPAAAKAEKARVAVRAHIQERVAATKATYQPGGFQTVPYDNAENNAVFAGSTMVVHHFRVKDTTDFVKAYHVSYLVTSGGKVYVREVFNPRR